MNHAETHGVRGSTRHARGRTVDWPGVVGLALLALIVMAAIYGPLIAPHDVYYTRALLDGTGPPFPPGPEFPLGSDSVGHDRFSWALIGARQTLVIALTVAMLRVALGGALALATAHQKGIVETVIRRIALSISSVPATVASLLAVIALGFTASQWVLALSAIGWAEPFHQIRRHARAELSRQYFEAAYGVGATRLRVIFRHLLPNLAPAMLVTLAFQIGAVLLVLGELALLSIFVGGSTIVDFDSRGRAIAAPVDPNWPSMLGTTRPIISLYGDLAAVLVPGGALLTAVIAVNLVADSLATRAQQLDIYRLWSARYAIVVGVAATVIAASIVLWPSRLERELQYARGLDSGLASLVARELAQSQRVTGSVEATQAAALIVSHTGGQIITGTERAVRVSNASFVVGRDRRVPLADFSVLSIDERDVVAPMVYADSSVLLSRSAEHHVRGAMVVLTGTVAPQTIGALAERAAAAGVVALVAADPLDRNYRREAGLYPLPVVRIALPILTSALGQPLPNLRDYLPRVAPLKQEARLTIRTETVNAEIVDVVTRVSAVSEDGPLILLAASFDAPRDTSARWATATSAGALVAVIKHLQRSSPGVEVVGVATSADHHNFAGTRLALTTLSARDRARLQAIIVIGPVLSERLVVQTQSDVSVSSGTGRLAARLRDATGLELESFPAGELMRAVISAGATSAPLTFYATGKDQEPAANALSVAARSVLTAVAYVATHQPEMR